MQPSPSSSRIRRALLLLLVLVSVPALAAQELSDALRQTVLADAAARGLPLPEEATPPAQRFRREEDGAPVSPGGERLVVVRLEAGNGVLLVAPQEGAYWSLARPEGGTAILNGPYPVGSTAPDEETIRHLLEKMPEAARAEREALLDRLLPAPGTWQHVARVLESLPQEESGRVQGVLLAQINSRIRAALAQEGDGGFYDGQFLPLARYGKGGVRVLLRILKDRSEEQTIRYYAAQALGELGDEEAAKQLREALSRRQLGSNNLNQAAVFALAKLGDREPVERIIQQLRGQLGGGEGQPLNAQAAFQLAQVHVRLGEHEECLELYRKVLEAEPTGPRAGLTHYNIACVLSVQGRLDEAFEELKEAIDLGGVDFDWMEKDGDLANLRGDPRWAELLERRAPTGPRRIY